MICGYFDEDDCSYVCAPCANRLDLDLEADHYIAVSDAELASQEDCSRCSIPLVEANVLRTCPHCGHLGTVGGGAR